jgi:hypothetical protein
MLEYRAQLDRDREKRLQQAKKEKKLQDKKKKRKKVGRPMSMGRFL